MMACYRRKEKMKMARKSYHRQFRKNGRSFMVQTTYKQDLKKPSDKYFLTMMASDGWYKIVHDPFGNLPMFGTIREAQDYAWSFGDFIDDQVW